MRKILLPLLAMIAAAGLAGAVYFLRLTAPVEVSDEPPIAPTLAPPGGRGVPADASPAAVAARTATGRAAIPGTAAVGRRYRVDPGQSRASYAVEETFLFENNRLFTAVGVTRGIAGEILLDPADPAAARVGEIVVHVGQLTSDEPRRDNAIRRIALESERYPLATFRTTALDGLPAAITPGTTYHFRATGELTLRTATRTVTWALTATLTAERLLITATAPIKMSDFGIMPPNLSDLRVRDDVTLTLELIATPVE